MTAFVQTAQAIFTNTWNLLTSITVPGLGGIHFSALYFGIFLIGVTFLILERAFKKKGDD